MAKELLAFFVTFIVICWWSISSWFRRRRDRRSMAYQNTALSYQPASSIKQSASAPKNIEMSKHSFHEQTFLGIAQDGSAIFKLVMTMTRSNMHGTLSFVRDGKQTILHSHSPSVPREAEAAHTFSGLISILVLEPQRRWRVTAPANNSGVFVDIEATALQGEYSEGLAQHHLQHLGRWSATHTLQIVSWRGNIVVDEARTCVDSFIGFRTRSWGARPSRLRGPRERPFGMRVLEIAWLRRMLYGAALHILPARPLPQFYLLRSFVWLQDGTHMWYAAYHDVHGVAWHQCAAMFLPNGGGCFNFAQAAHKTELRVGTRQVERASIGFRDASARQYALINLLPRYNLYNIVKSPASLHDSDNATVREDINIRRMDDSNLFRAAHVTTECAAFVTYSKPDGSIVTSEGYALLEQNIVGPYLPAGLTHSLSIA